MNDRDRQTTVVPSPRLCKAWARPMIYIRQMNICYYTENANDGCKFDPSITTGN